VIRYTKDEIRAKWKELLCNPDLIYSTGTKLFNYKGVLKDEPEMLYIEYISQLISEDFGILESIGTNLNGLRITKSFNVSHDGTSNATARTQKYGKIRFNEKPFALALYNSDHNFIFGKIFDYELPLKEKESSKYGEIDLLSRMENEVNVIELKIGYTDSGKRNETLLRAIMEAFTFTKLLNNRKEKFINNMELPKNILFRPVVLTLTNAICAEHMKMLEKGKLNNLKNLIDKMNEHFGELDILPFKFFAINADNPELIQDDKKQIVFKDQSFIYSKVVEYMY